MISNFDDYPIHQTCEPVTQPVSSDRNYYDRYWFNGFDKQGRFYIGAALGLYPNRQVMDAAFSLLVDGRQYSFHASRRASPERSELRVGPFTLEVMRPMRAIRLHLAPNSTGIECDLVFQARTTPYEEPRSVLRADGRVMLDTSRFAQFGTWQGYARSADAQIELRHEEVVGTRDRSWGIRPVGEPERGATPRSEPGIFWIWSVNHFDDVCTHYETFEDHDGRPILSSGALLPTYTSAEQIPPGVDPRVSEMASTALAINWQKGARWSRAAKLELTSRTGEKHLMTLEPLLRFHLKGIGYQHPEWGHGFWKGEEAIGGESWKVDELDPLAYENLHVQQVCRVRMGERVGIGALEQLVLGSHRPSGFKSFLDGAL
jgi:hypothetical protein